uniref:Uncharacterized protein n=1 Tax=Physcomitrium patens TaxID=3218 RepID=A0A2K1IH29_PHYPA|nr:hypothetical protein PHYPA_029178 [Physcomitrium patens]
MDLPRKVENMNSLEEQRRLLWGWCRLRVKRGRGVCRGFWNDGGLLQEQVFDVWLNFVRAFDEEAGDAAAIDPVGLPKCRRQLN